jgi:hypothetical protein
MKKINQDHKRIYLLFSRWFHLKPIDELLRSQKEKPERARCVSTSKTKALGHKIVPQYGEKDSQSDRLHG